jgi:hypothetical protein
MDAISLLNEQHDEVDELFEKVEKAKGVEAKEKLFLRIADALAIHTTIEEQIFYPAVKAKRTEDILLESLEEHLGIKRVLKDLLDLDPHDQTFDAKLQVLKEQVEHHVDEEKTQMFPKVRKLMDKAQLEALADEMTAMIEQLEGDAPRNKVRAETEEAAPL